MWESNVIGIGVWELTALMSVCLSHLRFLCQMLVCSVSSLFLRCVNYGGIARERAHSRECEAALFALYLRDVSIIWANESLVGLVLSGRSSCFSLGCLVTRYIEIPSQSEGYGLAHEKYHRDTAKGPGLVSHVYTKLHLCAGYVHALYPCKTHQKNSKNSHDHRTSHHS